MLNQADRFSVLIECRKRKGGQELGRVMGDSTRLGANKHVGFVENGIVLHHKQEKFPPKRICTSWWPPELGNFFIDP